jgi:hypothetical protein
MRAINHRGWGGAQMRRRPGGASRARGYQPSKCTMDERLPRDLLTRPDHETRTRDETTKCWKATAMADLGPEICFLVLLGFPARVSCMQQTADNLQYGHGIFNINY